MIEEVVQVSRVDGEEVWISVDRRSACSACSARKGCGQGALSELMPGKSVEVSVNNPVGLLPQVGQSVVVGLEEGSLMRASLLVYLLPLLLLVVCAMIARALGTGEGGQVLCGLAGLACGFLVVRWHARRPVNDVGYRPTLLRLV